MKRPLAIYLTVAILSVIYLYPFVRSLSDVPDSGIYLNGAYLVSQGLVPSRDFVELQGPGSFVWLAFFFRLFGATFVTAHGLLIATGTAMALLVLWISRRLGASGIQGAVFVLVISVPLLPINSPHYDSNLFALAALALFLAAMKSPSIWKLAASAALCGITTWTIQQKGVLLFVALLVSLIFISRKRAVLMFISAFLVSGLLPLAWFTALHALPNVWYANFVWPLNSYSGVNAAPYGFPIWQNLLTIVSQQGNRPSAWIVAIIFVTPFFVIAALPLLLPAAASLQRWKWFQKPLLPLWLASYALWLSEIHRKDIGHLRNGAILLALLFFAICETTSHKWLRRAAIVITLAVALGGTSHFLTSWEGQKRSTRHGDVYVKDNTALLDFLDVNTKRGDEVYTYPYQPIYYFVADLHNPTRYSNLTYGMNTPMQFQEAVQDLEHKQVRYVIYDTQLSGDGLMQVFPAYRSPDPSNQIAELYLSAHYRLLKNLGRFHVLERIK